MQPLASAAFIGERSHRRSNWISLMNPSGERGGILLRRNYREGGGPVFRAKIPLKFLRHILRMIDIN